MQQQYYPQGYQQSSEQDTGNITSDMIEKKIAEAVGASQASSAHDLAREAESNLISKLITNPELAKIFEGIEAGEHGDVFNAAYSGGGSAAAELVASAIDNAIYGLSEKYGDDAPEGLRGRSIPIKDPAVFQKVQDRVMEGLKELSAMSVFAATKQGMTDPPVEEKPIAPVALSGDHLTTSEAREKRVEEMNSLIQQKFNDLSSGPLSS